LLVGGLPADNARMTDATGIARQLRRDGYAIPRGCRTSRRPGRPFGGGGPDPAGGPRPGSDASGLRWPAWRVVAAALSRCGSLTLPWWPV